VGNVRGLCETFAVSYPANQIQILCNSGLLDDTIRCLKDFYNTIMNINNLPMKNSIIIININNNSVQYIIYSEAGASSYVLSQKQQK